MTFYFIFVDENTVSFVLMEEGDGTRYGDLVVFFNIHVSTKAIATCLYRANSASGILEDVRPTRSSCIAEVVFILFARKVLRMRECGIHE